MELLTAVVAFVVGSFLGVYMRRSAAQDFERGVTLGLAQLPNLVKTSTSVQPPRHEQHQPKQNGPQDKK